MSCDDRSLSDTAKHKWEQTSSKGGFDMRTGSVLSPLHHVCIQMPHTATLYCFILQGLGRFRSAVSHQKRSHPLLSAKTQVVSRDQTYLQSMFHLETAGLNMRLVREIIYGTTILLKSPEVLANRA